ncbi:hypothetical protein HV824_00685 [Myxococcus sp. AM009]|uniref:hypothetical protein n=1 Tax=unclassified Myxococcus TaxID=2648731 RepID=UPI0015956549|nr:MULTISPECIES: hypothetical protein [unclassified Myxococcus]NVI96641.1 hypothetical protein [Myxococcus sp. AM009]NVJ12677.1 hypothetical protein [Myxococcus sp. AM010]
MSESPDVFLLGMFQKSGLAFGSVDEAWQRSEHLYPLLGWLTARFPEPTAFQVCTEWLRQAATRVEGSAAAADLFAQARGEAPRQGHVIAGRLGDLRNASILERKPAVAAFADAASHLCEVWAAVTTNEGDTETNPWARAKAAAGAMVTALLEQRGEAAEDPAAKARARVELTELLRTARAAITAR